MSESEPPDNAIARAHRARLPDHNDFDIATLARQPPFWGWIAGRPGDGVTFRMLLGGNDDGVALRLFWNGHYERATMRLWTRLVRRARLALDVGAHTGIYTLAARAANPDVNVLSFEPHWANFARLTLNLQANGFATRDAYRLAVGRADATLPFTIQTHPDYLTTGGVLNADVEGLTEDVRVVALDSFLPRTLHGQVDLVKLDVEGHEAACLDGMADLVAEARPTIVVECLGPRAVSEVRTRLAALDYRFFEIDDTSDVVIEASAHGARDLPEAWRCNQIAAARPEDVAEIV